MLSSVTHSYKGKTEGRWSDAHSFIKLCFTGDYTRHIQYTMHAYLTQCVLRKGHRLLQSPVPRHTGQTQDATVKLQASGGSRGRCHG